MVIQQNNIRTAMLSLYSRIPGIPSNVQDSPQRCKLFCLRFAFVFAFRLPSLLIYLVYNFKYMSTPVHTLSTPCPHLVHTSLAF